MVVSACSIQSDMEEVHLLPLRVMHIAPFSGIQSVNVVIKQVVALCLQTPLKCSIAKPPQSLSLQHVPGSHFKIMWLFFCYQCIRKPSLKGAMMIKHAKLCFFF